jgi:hypothetical protein
MLNVFFISLKKIIMKKTILTSIMTFIFLLNVNAQQWIENNSCNKKASEIVNEAITSLSNLEHLMAIGMAKAALVVDKDCECAKLVIAAAASNNADWGSRDDKLKEINLKKLSEIEKTTLIAMSESYFTPAGSRPFFGASHPNIESRLTTSPSERGADK